MRRITIVLNRDFRELRQTSAFLIIVIIFSVITITAAAVINIILGRQEWLHIKTVALPILELIIGLMAYYLPLIILMTFIWAFSSLPIIKEKVNGNITSLCATPLTPKEIWIGKSLAIFLPGFVISLVSTLIVLLSVNIITVRPATGDILLPIPLMITSLVTSPLLFSGLLLFIILFSLAKNPDIAIAPSFIVGFGLMMGIPLGMITGIINLTSWSFCIWYSAGTALIWTVVIFLSRILTKENIVLSSKGD